MRTVVIPGLIRGTTWPVFHARKQALLNELAADAYPYTSKGPQPIRVRYNGATAIKFFRGVQEGGLGGGMDAARDPCFWEDQVLTLLAQDPRWFGIGQEAVHLDASVVLNVRGFAVRTRDVNEAIWPEMTSVWGDAGLTDDPDSGEIQVIIRGPDNKIYVGGTFVDWDNAGTGMDYVAVYDPATETWGLVGGASAFNSSVLALCFGPDGTLYAGGTFTNAELDPDADFVAKLIAGAWVALNGGSPDHDSASITRVKALAFDTLGILYIGGVFTNWDDIDAADYIVTWTGAAYAALGTGGNDSVLALARGIEGHIYVGGNFTTMNGVGHIRVCYYNTTDTTFHVMGSGFDDSVNCISIGKFGEVYVGGDFPEFPEVTLPWHVAMWNGSVWTNLDSGVADSTGASVGLGNVYDMDVAPDGSLYVVGSIQYLGSDAIGPSDFGFARWDGTGWSLMDLWGGATANIRAVCVGAADPTVPACHDIYVGGGDLEMFGSFSSVTDVTNSGSTYARPKIYFELTTAAADIARIVLIRNETTGRQNRFDYRLRVGEPLCIDTSTSELTITSDFYGETYRAVLPSSDLGNFELRPGVNRITVLLRGAAFATMLTSMVWDIPYRSYD